MAPKRYSRQRELIYETIRNTHSHPTAEMVFQQLKPDNPRLSLGTVYRNLNQLADEGLLKRMPFPVERYDYLTSPHSHLQCERCGSVSDLDLSYDPSMDAAAAALHPGAEIRRHDLVFYGLCPDCRARDEANRSNH